MSNISPVQISPKIHDSWKVALAAQWRAPYFGALKQFLKSEKAAGQKVYPPGKLIFNAFDCTPFDKVKVVILGQDPYHGPGQAHGLSFSVPFGLATPPSLVNIYKEINSDLGLPIPNHGNLEAWAKQGVLLLNSVLTVRASDAGSHAKKGWETFTDAVIEQLNRQREHLVFMLWGRYAKNKGARIDPQKHLVLTAAHPSPLAAYNGFFDCKHFSKAQQYMETHGIKPIDWRLESL